MNFCICKEKVRVKDSQGCVKSIIVLLCFLKGGELEVEFWKARKLEIS